MEAVNSKSNIRIKIAEQILRLLGPIIVVGVLVSVAAIWVFASDQPLRQVPALFCGVCFVICLWIARRGRVRLAAGLIISGGCIGILAGMVLNGGLYAPIFTVSLCVMAAMGWFYGARGAAIYWFASFIVGGGFVVAHKSGWIAVFPPIDPALQWILMSVNQLAILGVTVIPSRMLHRSLAESENKRAEAESARRKAEESSRNLEDRERMLRESEATLRTAQEMAHVGNWSFDLGTRTLTCSEEAARIHGVPRDALTYAAMQEAVLPDCRDMLSEEFRKLIRDKGAVDVEFRIKRLSDGEIIDIHAIAEFDPEKNTIFGTIQDTTAGKRAEREQEILKAQLNQAAKMEAIGRLAGGVAHDFNNLLTGIIGCTEMIAARIPDESPLREDVEEIVNLSKRAAGLTHQLLMFSRKQAVEPKEIDLNDAITDSTRMIKRMIGEDIEFLFRPAADVSRIRIDPNQLGQIILSLAVNARDAMPEGGEFRIETATVVLPDENPVAWADLDPGGYVLVAVSDNGIGMDRRVLDQIFEPFFTTKEIGRGTGLGLATVYGIVRQNRGGIAVESSPGMGTTFRIVFPQAAPSGEPDPELPGSLQKGGTETVFLVEDDSVVRDLVVRMLTQLGYAVVAAGNGAEAVAMFMADPDRFDILLTDVIMPGMNGNELHLKLREAKPGLKTLFMSGYLDDAIAGRGILKQGARLLRKPFSVEQLAAYIRETLDSNGD